MIGWIEMKFDRVTPDISASIGSLSDFYVSYGVGNFALRIATGAAERGC